MRILYLAFSRIPTEKAHGLQIMKTCEALAETGAEVELVVPTRKNHLRDEPFAYYGVRKLFKLSTIRTSDFVQTGKIGFLISLLSFAEKAHFHKSFWEADVIYSRDALVLLQYIFLGRHLVYEAHQAPTFVSKIVARRAQRVVSISEGLKKAYVAAGVSSEKIVVAPDGIDLEEFSHPESKESARARLGLPQDAKLALYIGRLDGWKGVDTLCEAARLLDEDIKVVVIGGEPEQVESFKKKYPVVTFLGYRPYSELADNQAAADVLILPNTAKNIDSAEYTSPLKLFSYMASNRPIVASDLPSLREVLSDDSAYFVEPDNAAAFAEGIENVFSETSDATRKASRAFELVQEYSWKSRAEIILGTNSQDVDVCVIGAGPAGIALAESLAEAGKGVCLVESGGYERSEKADDLNTVVTDKLPIKHSSRTRALGGTTKLWLGRWKLLDAIDFEKRAEIPNSGWPISQKEVLSSYEEAVQRFNGIPFSRYTPQIKELISGSHLDSTVLWTIRRKFFDVGAIHRKNLLHTQNISLLLNTTLLTLDRTADEVTRAVCIKGNGQKVQVNAKQYVLATGGIENARQLLASGIGSNATGKHYMDHPKGVQGKIILAKGHKSRKDWFRISEDIGVYRVGYRLSDEVIRKEGLLNPYVQLEPIYPQTLSRKILRKFGVYGEPQYISVMSYFDQAPVEQNQITLTAEKDRLGVPVAKVSWELSALDKKSMQRLYEMLAEELMRSGIGTLESSLLTSTPDWSHIRDASHHMGTTRMGTTPDISVVDTDCKVHGMKNLYVAGSSVFPTGGHANPTATLIALALRLAHHLAKID